MQLDAEIEYVVLFFIENTRNTILVFMNDHESMPLSRHLFYTYKQVQYGHG